MGEMADWIADQWDCGDYYEKHEQPRTCKFCGFNELWWENINGKWRLVDESGEPHVCDEYKTGQRTMSIYGELNNNPKQHRLSKEIPDEGKWHRMANQWRDRANKYWKFIQQYQGKVAVLRHENNKLRKANEKMRDELAALRELRDEVIKEEIERDAL